MELGIVGLGKMGGGLALQAAEKGIRVVGTTRPPVNEALRAAGVEVADDMAGLVRALASPRMIILFVPAGPAVDEVLAELAGLLSPGDLVMDGGNSFFRDSAARHHRMAQRGIAFLDVGTSGGPGGARQGACFMVGGAPEAAERARPLLERLAVPEAFLYAGPPGAGHFVKLVHNAIEFGMMQAIAEGLDLLTHSDYNLDLARVFHNWSHGSVIESRLVSWMETALSEGPPLAEVDPYVDDTGEVNWIIQEAAYKEVPIPTIAQAVWALMQSRDAQRNASRAVAMMRHQFGGHAFGPAPAIAEERHVGRIQWAPYTVEASPPTAPRNRSPGQGV